MAASSSLVHSRRVDPSYGLAHFPSTNTRLMLTFPSCKVPRTRPYLSKPCDSRRTSFRLFAHTPFAEGSEKANETHPSSQTKVSNLARARIAAFFSRSWRVPFFGRRSGASRPTRRTVNHTIPSAV